MVHKFVKLCDIYCNYYYYGSIHLTDLNNYYLSLAFPSFNLFPTKKRNNTLDPPVVTPDASTEPKKNLKGQADRWERSWFSVRIRPLIKWLSWSVTVTNKY